jgi:hypothetical protein
MGEFIRSFNIIGLINVFLVIVMLANKSILLSAMAALTKLDNAYICNLNKPDK